MQDQGTEQVAKQVESGAAPSPAVKEASTTSESPKPKLKKRSRDLIRTERKSEGLASKASSWAIPIMVLVALIIIVIVVFIPFGTEIMDTLDEAALVQADVDTRIRKLNQLEEIELRELEGTLDVVESVVRDDMDVAELASEVEKVAVANNLEPKQISMSDESGVLLEAPDETFSISSVSDTMSGPFAFFGKFSDVTSFLYELRNNSSTILALDAVYLSRYNPVDEEVLEGDEPMWGADLLISGFTTEPVRETDVKTSIKTSVDDDLIDEITSRSPLQFIQNNDGDDE
ncbi:MAG: hypothetical protein U9Q67_01070 [Patescibacteria group bacterium]|nr:hypothetical protein [Patescibacteria group bacterium]